MIFLMLIIFYWYVFGLPYLSLDQCCKQWLVSILALYELKFSHCWVNVSLQYMHILSLYSLCIYLTEFLDEELSLLTLFILGWMSSSSLLLSLHFSHYVFQHSSISIDLSNFPKMSNRTLYLIYRTKLFLFHCSLLISCIFVSNYDWFCFFLVWVCKPGI